MSRVARIIGNSGYMHIYSRGVNKQDIFLRTSDYTYFLKTISDLSEEMGFDIIAYCLMPNHYHLVIYDSENRFSMIIKRLSISYSMHFNSVYDRVGPLFQGRFGSRAIEDIMYLLTVIRYVHMNPEKAGICAMNRYKWSSYSEYFRAETQFADGICNTGKVLDIIGGIAAFKAFHAINDDWVHKELEGPDLSDEEAVRIVCRVIGRDSPAALMDYSRKIRDDYIRSIREQGVPNKQLSRITGLSIYVIQHVHK